MAPPSARAFPPEFPSGSSDSRGKLNILGQGEAGCQVPTLHGVLPPPPSPPPPPPPTPQPSPPPPAAQIPAQSQRPRRCGCGCRRPRTRPLQPAPEPISAGGESGFSTRNATGQAGELGTVGRDSLIPAPRSLRSAGEEGRGQGGGRGGGLGRIRGRRLCPGRRGRRSYSSLPPLLLRLLLLLFAELPRAPTKTSAGVWLRAPAPSDRAAVSLRGEKHVTEPPRPAAGPPPGGSRPGPYIPGRARPAPAPLRPRPCRRGARAGLCAQRAGSAPARPAVPAQRHRGRPGPQGSPRRARAGVFGWLPESARGVWENGRGRARRDAGVRVGAAGGHCGCRAPSGRAGEGRAGGPDPT